MRTAITLRKAAIETARKITSKQGNKETAKQHFNNAVREVEAGGNAIFLSPEEFYRRIYNSLIKTLKTS